MRERRVDRQRRVDRDRRPGKFLLTGSANVLNLPKLADSLAGRMEIVDLLPFSQGELEDRSSNFVDLAFGSDFNPKFDVEDGKIVYHRVYWGWRGFEMLIAAQIRESEGSVSMTSAPTTNCPE